MNKAYIKLENELRDEIMLRKLHKRSEKYKHLNDNEICILMLAMVRKICRGEICRDGLGGREHRGQRGCRGRCRRLPRLSPYIIV